MLSHLLVLTLLALAFVTVVPLAAEKANRVIQKRRAHVGQTCHWYTNFNENLEYEPKNDRDIDRLTIDELRSAGYKPTGTMSKVPRTFRGKVAGDHHIQLWVSSDEEQPPRWICRTK